MDQVGRGSLEGSVERLAPCLADNYSFEFSFSADSPAIVCPGPGCPIQEYLNMADLRARFAQAFFVDAGYLAIQHQMLNIEVDRRGRHAEVSGYIQANHFLADSSVDIAWNDYRIETVKKKGRWKIERESTSSRCSPRASLIATT